MRHPALQDVLDAAKAAFAARDTGPEGDACLARIFAALETPDRMSDTPGARLPVCDWLADAADPEKFNDATLNSLIAAFLRLEPALQWKRRSGDCDGAGPGFPEGHANAMIVGPGGLERRSDVWMGVSLTAPHIRYPDHTHPPEETYLVLSPGAFRQGDGDWFYPGIGGTLYNPPGIVHAMRSTDAPLFALWTLWAAPHGT